MKGEETKQIAGGAHPAGHKAVMKQTFTTFILLFHKQGSPAPKLEVHVVKYEKRTAQEQSLLCRCIAQFKMEKGRVDCLHLYK